MKYSLESGIDTSRESAQKFLISALPIFLALVLWLGGPAPGSQPDGAPRTPVRIYTLNTDSRIAKASAVRPAVSVGQSSINQPSQTMPSPSPTASTSTTPAAPTSSPSGIGSGSTSVLSASQPSASGSTSTDPLSLTYTITAPSQSVTVPGTSKTLLQTSSTSITVN